MKYKIHTAYINNNGSIVPAGIYDEYVIDVAEARHKSIITLSDVELETTVQSREDIITVKKVDNASYEEGKYFKELTLEPTIEVIKVKHININIDSEEIISKIKYVGKVIARKVITERNNSFFNNYNELDQRVPLSFNRKWQDVSALTFDKPEDIKPQQEFTQSV